MLPRTAAALVELIVPAQDVGETDDRVQRRAQLVAHRRQEVALEPVHLEERAGWPGPARRLSGRGRC